jgi:trimethylamine--corrinoid protein Co-methyltransferase
MALTPRIRWFSKGNREKIVGEAKRILEEIGVFVENAEAVSLLDGGGARVDREKGRVFIPAPLVDRALETAPERVLVYNRFGEAVMDLGGDRVHFNPGSAALRIYDYREGRARTPLTRDLVRFATLVDALPHYSAQSTGVIPGDVPEEVADRYRLYIALQYSVKPVVTGTFKVDAFRPMHAMLAAVIGDQDTLREKPIAIFDCCPSPPLKWSDLTAQALIDCARTGIPAELVSMPLTGATSPVTLAGAVTQHCAESLSGVVIHQLARPGAPIIYGGSPACFDMRKGTTPMGAVETQMIDGAYAEIGKHLGLPTHAYMALSDSKLVDYQAGMESALGAAIAALSGINNVSGPGMLDFESCQSLEKLVLDHEICGMALRLSDGIALRDQPIALPLIEAVLGGKEFLSLPHTKKWFRREAYFPDPVIDRATLQEWEQKGRSDAPARAAARVEKLLGVHAPQPLEPEVLDFLTDIMTREAKRAGMEKLPAIG